LDKLVLLLLVVLLAWLGLKVFRFALRLVFLALALAVFGVFYYKLTKKR
jgi:hypothetical protein